MSTINPVQAVPATNRGMHILLWVLQVVLAIFFIRAGYARAFVPIEEAAVTAAWVADFPTAVVRLVGIVQLAGVVGLILPAATRIMPWLTPLAAAGLAAMMVLAVPFHLVRGETSIIWINIIVAAVAGFVAWGRLRLAPIPPRS